MTDNISYRIRRFYCGQRCSALLRGKGGLTLEQAQAHCKNPETSSRTCTGKVAKDHTARYGTWFDGYEADPTT